MSFISDYISSLSPAYLIHHVYSVLDNSQNALSLTQHICPDKQTRYRELQNLIKFHMPEILNHEFNVDKLQPDAKCKSWDDYILSFDSIIKKTLVPYLKKLLDLTSGVIEASKEKEALEEKITSLKLMFIDFLEKANIYAGLNTAFQNIYSLLRVIPILAQNTTGCIVNKTNLTARITSQVTQKFLRKIMVLNAPAMNVLTNILWQRPVESIGEARNKLDDYESPDELIQLALNPSHSRLYHPDNFQLKDDGIEFSTSGEHYYQAAKGFDPENKAQGCPALHVRDLDVDATKFSSTDATAVVCQLVGQIISLIPDDKFEALIRAPRTGYDTIRQEVNKFIRQKAEKLERLPNRRF